MAKEPKVKKVKEPKAKKPTKPPAPFDPVKARNLIRLLNALALILAISAFLFQLIAVLTHHWKWQSTGLHPIISPTFHYAQPNIYQDSRLDQSYGLFSREVKLYANNDEQLDVLASTRFPRVDDGDAGLHHCLSHTTSLRGAFLTCSDRIVSPQQCQCRRYCYWNFVIFFEILALILLGIALFLIALQTTQFHGIFKPAAAGLALLAFICLFIGLILILSHLKRETRSIADTYPHLHQRIGEKLAVAHDSSRAKLSQPTVLRRAVRRQAHETYRAYSLARGQHPFNETHFQEYSEQARSWIYKTYASLSQPIPYAPIAQPVSYAAALPRAQATYTLSPRPKATAAPTHNEHGPLLGYNQVFDNTRACIGWSTVLSIIAMVLALLLPLLLVLSWLTGKKLGSDVKPVTTTTTTVKAEYVPVPQEVTLETVPLTRDIPTDYDPRRPIGDAIVAAQNVRQGPYDSHGARTEPFIVRDVIIRDENPTTSYTQQYSTPTRNLQEHSFPVNVETSQTSYRA